MHPREREEWVCQRPQGIFLPLEKPSLIERSLGRGIFFSPRNFSSGKENLSNNYSLYVLTSCWKSNKTMDFSFNCISEWHTETKQKVPFQIEAFSCVIELSQKLFLFFFFFCSFSTFLSFHTEEWDNAFWLWEREDNTIIVYMLVKKYLLTKAGNQ